VSGQAVYRIRFHGRGGQGMKTAGQILGSALFLEGYEVQDAPRYGAERRGAPIFSYVRAARTPIYERGVIARPDLVVVADESLVPVPAAGVLQGVGPDTTLLLNSADSAPTWSQRLHLAGPVVCLPVGAQVQARTDLPYVGTICAAAAARLLGMIRRESLAQAIRDEVGKFGDVAVQKSLEHALPAFDALAAQAGLVKEGTELGAGEATRPDWIDMPFDEARLSAPEIRAPATSELANTGVWRTFKPVIDYALCKRCSWVCSTLCPDSAIDVGPDHAPRIDYDHCKGCMVCVAVCPPHAIRAELENVKVKP
jgi:pyruvate ferredoxin oxidoreductase gamma subunit